MKPILFNTAMVQAILDGRKTVTRRVIKPQPPAMGVVRRRGCSWDWALGADYEEGRLMRPPYKPGDILWVRETWCKMPYGYAYRADSEMPTGWDRYDRWRPSIHMPREAARIFLRVTEVRAERVQEITGEQAMMEGCEGFVHANPLYGCPETVHNFRNLWDDTIPKKNLPLYGWDANPWVWAIEFEQIEGPEEDWYDQNLC